MAKDRKKTKRQVIKPGKDIVASMADAFKKKLLKVLDKGQTELIIDLAGVEMVDAVGLGVMVAAHNSLNKTGGKLTVTNVSHDIYGLFEAMRLDQHFEVRPLAG
jgi:anti-sigma B factor antagonist